MNKKLVNKLLKREVLGKGLSEPMDLPSLIEVQLRAYENFLQASGAKKERKSRSQGLEEIFNSIFPIERPDGALRLEYDHYILDYDSIQHNEEECRKEHRTYAVPVRARINLIFLETGEIRQKDIYFCDLPLMTSRGTFVVNGAERVVVSQIHRSPGVVFAVDAGVVISRIIPFRGAWIEFEIDAKNNMFYAKIDRKKRILGTVFLRAIGYKNTRDIINCFYQHKSISLTGISKDKVVNNLVGKILAEEVSLQNNAEESVPLILRSGQRLHPQDVEDIFNSNLKHIDIIDLEHPESLHSRMIFDCIEAEEAVFAKEFADNSALTAHEMSLSIVASSIFPGSTTSIESAEKEIHAIVFDEKRYDLGEVGRYKLNTRFNYQEKTDARTLTLEDIITTAKYLIQVYIGEKKPDDIDHLSNRRIRTVDELLVNQLKNAFVRVERIAKDRMSVKEYEALRPQDMISIKPIIAAINEFFGLSQLSQFMDQVNPLAELTHKRRVNALGPGGLTRERAGFEVRDVHYTHYGRMCPIETPEGQNIGLIISLANFSRINKYGFLEAPYRKVTGGKVTDDTEYLSAIEEERYFIAQADAELNDNKSFVLDDVPVRKGGDFTTCPAQQVEYMDVSPRQIVSISASLIPFLEHDDANRALMGSNMQRQAVPLLFAEPPRVGTGMEFRSAYDSGAMVIARKSGVVSYVDAEHIEITEENRTRSRDIQANPDSGDSDKGKDISPRAPARYNLMKYQRSNQDTCLHQRAIVKKGQKITAGDIIADGTSTSRGDLALGRNVLVGLVPWYGYNFEDAILVSERLVKEDVFTSIHIKEFALEVRETKLGPEKITADIPNTSQETLSHLSEEGVVYIGALVKSGDILVGKVTPKSENDTSPEFRLLNSIFGEKAREVRDTSLRVPHGVDGTVIEVQRIDRSKNSELNPGVIETVKVLVASKRKIKEGDKMAGRHGNKGVVAKVVPIEEMPYMSDGTPLDVCLSPLGVPSRMNIGQLLETELGWAAHELDEWYATPVFESPSEGVIRKKLRKAKLPESSKVVLYDGKTGEPFENPTMVGYMYLLKLHHLVDDKMHARSTGPYSLVTQQPLGGKAQFGGQRLGEMEVWALEAYGAANILQELLTIKSDDMSGRTRIYENIVKSEPITSPGVPESFHVLVQELRSLGLDLNIFDKKGNRVALTERDEELVAREGSAFFDD